MPTSQPDDELEHHDAGPWAQLLRHDVAARPDDETQRLDDFIAELARGAPYSAELCKWLRAGARDYVDAEGARSLDDCLGLASKPGEASLNTRMNRLRARTALYDAWSTMRPDHRSAWACSRALAEEIATFRERFFRKWQEAGAAPAGTSRLRQALFALFSIGVRFPEGQRGIHEAIGRSRSVD